MKLFVFEPNETGYDSFFVMSESLGEAIESVKKLKGNGRHNSSDYEKYKDK